MYQLTIVPAGCFFKYFGFIQTVEQDRVDACVRKCFCLLSAANQDRQLAILDGVIIGFEQLS